MKLSGSQPAWRRRAFVILGVAVTVACGASWVRAQQQTTGQTTGQTPAQPQQSDKPDPFKLSSDGALFLNFIKADKAADFEEVWKTIRTKLSTSDKPDYKAFADALKIYKLDGPPDPQRGVTFLLFADPTPKVSFDPGKILYESGLFERADADALYGRIKELVHNNPGIVPWPLVSLNK